MEEEIRDNVIVNGCSGHLVCCAEVVWRTVCVGGWEERLVKS